jgi:hypothetical protein
MKLFFIRTILFCFVLLYSDARDQQSSCSFRQLSNMVDMTAVVESYPLIEARPQNPLFQINGIRALSTVVCNVGGFV